MDELLRLAVEPCGKEYRAVDLRVKVCGRPLGHDSIHFVTPTPADATPTRDCTLCGRREDFRAFTICDACSVIAHPACLVECDRCGELICPEHAIHLCASEGVSWG